MNSLATALVRGQLQGRGLLIDRDAGLTVCQSVPNGTTKRDCSWPVFTRSRFPSRNLPFVRHRGLYTFEIGTRRGANRMSVRPQWDNKTGLLMACFYAEPVPVPKLTVCETPGALYFCGMPIDDC